MTLISLQDISLSFGGEPVLDKINLQIESGERICLVGRNGEGKSSLLKLLNGDIKQDSGRIVRQQQGVKVALLSQVISSHHTGSIYDVVAAGLENVMELLTEHHLLTARLAENSDKTLLAKLAAIEQELEITGAWNHQQQIKTILSRLQLKEDQEFSKLSGGMKRRALLAKALVSSPDLLLLDEPTNHLDIEAITWLEEFLTNWSCTLLFVTHDRTLLKKIATRILDLDRGKISSWPGNYNNYLRRKEEMLAAENGLHAAFDKKLAQEEIWIRQGIKARRTRNQGRVRSLLKMRQERQERREQIGRVRMEITEAGLSGRIVAVLKNVSYGYGNQPIITAFTSTILRGDRIGIIGPNGVGKTTLLKLLLGELSPSTGTIKLGTNLQPTYFDQQREQLDAEETVAYNLSEGSDFLDINGRRRHVIGYLRDFLFPPDRARSPVKILSGGERNRLLLAKLFARPSNILVLDEPTNDLDIETLELLEDLLLNYNGTVLLVSHDREFLDNTVTNCLVFEGNGRVQEYVGGYEDWLRRKPQSTDEKTAQKKPVKDRRKLQSTRPRKLTFKENRELEQLPHTIETLEAEQQTLFKDMSDPAFYQQEGIIVAEAKSRLDELERLLADAYNRWQELETVREEEGNKG